MSVNNGALSFDSYIENSQFKRTLEDMERRIIMLSDKTVAETGRMDTTFHIL